jgi:hypothetical protein
VTTARLRELMDERVADVEGRDLAAPAWARADAVRRRRRYALVGTTAAAVLVLAGGIAVLDERTGADVPPSSRPTSTPSDSPSASPTLDDRAPQAVLSGRFRGAPFWWAPPVFRDADLPVLQVPGLPEEISFADSPYVGTPPDHVDAVFGTGHGQYQLFSDETMVSVDLADRLGPVGDGDGNAFDPLSPKGVSPDGTEVFFRQPGRVQIWDLPTNTWRTVETLDFEILTWTRDGRLGVTNDGRPDPWDRGDHQWSSAVAGPDGKAAELDWMAEGVGAPSANVPDAYGNPEFLAAGTPDDPELLAFGMGRNKMCCPPMAWFSHDFVLFPASSPDGSYRILAWRVGTPDLYRVSEYVDLPPRNFSASWAENAFR